MAQLSFLSNGSNDFRITDNNIIKFTNLSSGRILQFPTAEFTLNLTDDVAQNTNATDLIPTITIGGISGIGFTINFTVKTVNERFPVLDYIEDNNSLGNHSYDVVETLKLLLLNSTSRVPQIIPLFLAPDRYYSTDFNTDLFNVSSEMLDFLIPEYGDSSDIPRSSIGKVSENYYVNINNNLRQVEVDEFFQPELFYKKKFRWYNQAIFNGAHFEFDTDETDKGIGLQYLNKGSLETYSFKPKCLPVIFTEYSSQELPRDVTSVSISGILVLSVV